MRKFGQKLYFKINKSHLWCKEVGTSKTFETKTMVAVDQDNHIAGIGDNAISLVNQHDYLSLKDGFGDDRIIIGDFDIAEQVIMYSIKNMVTSPFFFLRPVTIVHIVRDIANILTQVEIRSIIDVFEASGSIKVILYRGKDLNDQTLLDKDFYKGNISCGELIKLKTARRRK